MGDASEKQKIDITKIDSKVFRNLKCSNLKDKNLLRFPLLKFIGKKIPDYNLELSESHYLKHVTNMSSCLELFLASKRYSWGLLNIYVKAKKYPVALIRKFGHALSAG